MIANPTLATFAAFGSFAMLLLVEFGGPMRNRLQAQAALAAVGAVFVCLGTLASRSAWLAAVAMALVGFGVLFAGVVSSVLAGATPALLLSFILPVSLPGPASSIPDRLEGWGMASGGGVRRRRAAVAGAGSRPAPPRGDRGLPGGGRAAACGGRLPARGRGRPVPAPSSTTRSRARMQPSPRSTARSSRRRTGPPA